jgi:hypothetical protein
MRRAYVCQSSKCVPPRRVFLLKDEPIPKCSEHNQRMVPQLNMLYEHKKSPAE